jgi:hypothetical protein
MPSDPSGAPAAPRPPITAAPSGVTAFVGRFAHGPTDLAIELTDPADAVARFGHPLPDGDTAVAIAQFFANGGQRAYAVRVASDAPLDPAVVLGSAAEATGLHALATAPDVDLVCLPDVRHLGEEAAGELLRAAQEWCVARRVFLLVDAPEGVDGHQALVDWLTIRGLRHPNAALYVPRVVVADGPSGGTRPVAPSGAVAGVYARTDHTRGVWKSPAGPEADLRDVLGLDVALTQRDQEQLGPAAVNTLRAGPAGGPVVWGARTLVGDDTGSEWTYVAVRRTALFLERSLTRGLAWTASEPNAAALWSAIRGSVELFLDRLWRQGAFQGAKPDHASFVRCGLGQTMTQADVDAGVVVVQVGFAPLAPAEFVVLRLRLSVGGAAGSVDAALRGDVDSGVPLDVADLPRREVEVLRRVAERTKRRSQRATRRLVRGARTSQRGARIVLAGPSGTRKTLAARTLAGELGTDLVTIDLGQVASRYIAETEENLARVLEAAAASDLVLLLDEADALFGRRTEIADAHDGYADAVSHLVALLRSHPGAVVLATEDAPRVRDADIDVDQVIRFPRRWWHR